MLRVNKILQRSIICSLLMMLFCRTVQGQNMPPTWWFGVSGAANLNFYDGTTQTLNNSLIVPTAFHKAFGVTPYGSVLMEYRPGRIWGFMLNVGYDGRGAKYDNEAAPCDCPETLKADINYVTIEPSLRLGFNTTNLYFFAGPRLAFNVDKDFSYTELKQPNTHADFSNIQNSQFSGQVGIGYDFIISAPTSSTWRSLSPFASYQPYFGQEPRTIESLSITTIRIGLALKFGRSHKAPVKEAAVAPDVPQHDFNFSVRGPVAIPFKRQVSETFPLLNVVFFDEGSAAIPGRYITLTREQAADFKEEQLQKTNLEDMTGRSAGQLFVYHNVLNILGERMRMNTGSTIVLDGSSAKGPQDAKLLAEAIKHYLITAFGVDEARIAIQGGHLPGIPSQEPGATKDIALLQAEDRRVDIKSSSPELLMQVGGGMMKPVQITSTQVDPLDSQVIFNVELARQLLKSWSIDVTGSNGAVQHYGPFNADQESVPGKLILGDSPDGDFKIVMQGETLNGLLIRKEASLHLVRQNEAITRGFRYSIVFGFDKAKTLASYNKFLTAIVAPLITDGSTVIIHGHTDIIGSDDYNNKLSTERAQQTQKIIEDALANTGRNNIKFETFGFGDDVNHSPFLNTLPEERFYNRTVIIDIVPANK